MAKKKTITSQKKKLDRIFSEYIRKRDADEWGDCACITCKKRVHWKGIHAGHFMSRKDLATRYDEKNVHSQCPGCNTFNNGRQYEYAIEVDERYGEGTADELLRKSKTTVKWSVQDYEKMIQWYQRKLKDMKCDF